MDIWFIEMHTGGIMTFCVEEKKSLQLLNGQGKTGNKAQWEASKDSLKRCDIKRTGHFIKWHPRSWNLIKKLQQRKYHYFQNKRAFHFKRGIYHPRLFILCNLDYVLCQKSFCYTRLFPNIHLSGRAPHCTPHCAVQLQILLLATLYLSSLNWKKSPRGCSGSSGLLLLAA